jgi:hypothetical protein
MKLTTREGAALIVELYVLGYDAPSSVGNRSALCLQRNVVFLAGSFVVCVTPQLDRVIWARDCDAASCFDLYALSSTDDLIAHCELDIVRLSSKGDILWKSGGYDIFTGPFRIEADTIHATDFNDTEYAIRLDTGKSTIVRRGSSTE